MSPHTGTETRTGLLREAGVRNIGQWGEPEPPTPRAGEEGGLTGFLLNCFCKRKRKFPLVGECDGTVGNKHRLTPNQEPR